MVTSTGCLFLFGGGSGKAPFSRVVRSYIGRCIDYCRCVLLTLVCYTAILLQFRPCVILFLLYMDGI